MPDAKDVDTAEPRLSGPLPPEEASLEPLTDETVSVDHDGAAEVDVDVEVDAGNSSEIDVTDGDDSDVEAAENEHPENEDGELDALSQEDDPDLLDHEQFEPADEEGEEGSSIVLAAVVPLLLITGLLAFAVILLFGRSRFDDEAATTVVDPSERPELSPIEPDGDLEITGPGIIETFKDGDSTGLGETDNGRNWGELVGQWDIVDGAARLVRDPQVRSLAAVDTGVINGTMMTTFVHARAGSGLVFRLIDARNYWMVVAVPNAATWNVRKVVDGIATDVTNLGLASSDDGVTISVTFDRDVITLGLNGEQKASFTDNTHQGATTVGFTALGGTSGEVAWDNLIVTPLVTPRG